MAANPARRIELFLGGAWVNVTGDVYNRVPITLTSGRSPDATQTEPANLRFSLNNEDGKWSPKNPMAPYYGEFGRNVPVRFSIEGAVRRLYVPWNDDATTTPDTAALDLTGDLDLRVDRSGRCGGENFLIGKGTSTYGLGLTEQGVPFFRYQTAADGVREVRATAPIPHLKRLTVRATLDANNGASGHTITFYTSDSLTGTFTQLGDAIVVAGTVTLSNTTGTGRVGNGPADSYVYAAQIRSSIGGTVVANPDFTIQSEGATSFADSTGKTWTVGSQSSVTSLVPRFIGELSSMQVGWDTSENDVWLECEAAGILRRLGQGRPDNRSMYRSEMQARNPLAYWPMEDGTDSVTFASVTEGTEPAEVTRAGVVFADDSSFVASFPLPVMNDGTVNFDIPSYTATGFIQMRFLGIVRGDQESVVARLRTTGSLNRYEIYRAASVNGMGVRAYAGDTLVADSGAFNFSAYLDTEVRWSLEITQDGSDVDFGLVVLLPGETTGAVIGATGAGRTCGIALEASVGTSFEVTGLSNDSVFGHFSIETAISSIFDLAEVLDGYEFEGARNRIDRIAASLDIEQYSIGLDSSALGIGQTGTTLDKIQDAVNTDGGVLIEPRGFLGLQYRTRRSMYSQPPAYVVSYGSLTPETAPVEDDLLTRNDVTVTRRGGSSGRYVIESGPLSIQEPPDGVGPYVSEEELSLAEDGQALYHASWRANMGTVDEPRFPTVGLDVHSPYLSGDLADIVDVQIGDLIEIENPPSWWPAETQQQVVFQITEVMTLETYSVKFACRPRGPLNVALISAGGRIDSDNSTLTNALNSSATSFSVTGGGDLWVTTAINASAFPFDIEVGGEVMTVSGITSATSPQTFTVTRSVNGIVKSHLAGARVGLAEPYYIGL